MKACNKTIGINTPRAGAVEKLKGHPLFCADMEHENTLVLKAFRSSKSHAGIVDIDLKKALEIEGVVQIFTARDIAGKNLIGIINKDQPVLVPDKVRYTGDPIALIAAETEQAAEKAIEALEVIYEEHQVVLTPEEAMKDGAPKIHAKGNVLFTRNLQHGNTEKAFKQCKAVVEKTYRTSPVEHAYLEPDAGYGYVDEDGTLVIYASTQNPHYDHKEVVDILGVKDDKVRIIQAATGGGFGSKLDLNVQGFIGLALFHLNKPVRYVYSREEAFVATAKRHPLTIHMKTGADQYGNVMAMKARIVCDTGAYGSYGIAVASRAAVHATGPYEIENVEVAALCVYTNNPYGGAMRGFGAPQMAFAHESQMDLLATELDIDPLEIRRINAFKPGSVTATGQEITNSVGFIDCLDTIKPYWDQAKKDWMTIKPDPFKRRGIGLGSMWYGIGNTGVQNPSTARIEMDLEGGLTLYTGCADIGQGSTTVLLKIAAEVLGVQPEGIKAVVADTKWTTNAGATSASRQTYISGNAVKDAAKKIADVMLTEAVDRLRTPKSSLIFDSGFVIDTKDPSQKISFKTLVSRLHKRGIPLVWQGYFDPETIPLDPATGQGVPYATYAFACQMALVTVDTLTGEVRVDKIVAAHDVGKAIYPEGVKGQICGGIAMGIGFALMEKFDPGQTQSMKDYLIPTCGDMPEIIPLIVESEEPSGPFGAKGVGEPALIPTAPSILNALANALGERIFALPANLERVLEASIKSGHFGKREDS